mmetsp:Transcript_30384/g.5497  ORF Transcript_30384/g.5497 Transcript_30384/m.5497 type:complete len:118 (+) Transcript_30384:145-498(+)
MYAVTASRGRGKSAALGLCISAAIFSGFSHILVSAPSPENLKALFEFVIKGLEALDYKQNLHYEVIKGTEELANCVIQIKIKSKFMQTISYVTVNSSFVNADLMIIDEAAAIPIPML